VSGATVAVATRVMRHFDLPNPTAVHVLEVVAGSPAALAGVLPGDRIVALRSQPVDGIDGLQRLLDGSCIGRDCELTLLRRASLIRLVLRPTELSSGAASR